VKHWQETTEVLGRIATTGPGRRSALATVVRIRGSAYRRPGAKFLIDESGDTLGGVSGGCLEADVRQVGLALEGDDTSVLRVYETGSGDQAPWGLGVGCEGTVEVFIQTITPALAKQFERVRQLLDGDRAFTMSTILTGPHAGRLVLADDDGVGGAGGPTFLRTIVERARALLADGVTSLDELGGVRVFTETLLPPPWLLVFGAGDDARALVSAAATVGFRVVVVDHRPAYLTPSRFPGATRLGDRRPEEGLQGFPISDDSFAVVMTHASAPDRAWLRHLLATEIPYVGVLGPRDRTARFLAEIGSQGERVYGPVGLDVGADGPEQVALSILSELLSVRAGREPRHLREREVEIHA
jgi:xanthine dehydrogenase accessory factor